MRILVGALFAACSYSHGTVPDQPGHAPDSGVLDGTVESSMCDHGGDVRLCLEFDDGVVDPIHDSSPDKRALDTSNILVWEGKTGPGAQLVGTGFVVPETTSLDISPNLTFEMWLKPTGTTGSATLLDNQGQYSMRLDFDHHLSCRFGSSVVSIDDDRLPANTWTYVACVHAGSVIRAYAINVGKAVVKCNSAASAIALSGITGTQVATGYAGVLDDVRIYAEALSGTEICTHADNNCPSPCD